MSDKTPEKTKFFSALAINMLFPGLGQFIRKRMLSGIIFSSLASISLLFLLIAFWKIFSRIYAMAFDEIEIDEVVNKQQIIAVIASLSLLIFTWLASFAEIILKKKNSK